MRRSKCLSTFLKVLGIVTFGLVAFIPATMAQHVPLTPGRTAEIDRGWRIVVPETAREPCGAIKIYNPYPQDMMISVWQGSEGRYSVTLSSAAWKSLKAGKKYRIELRFGEGPLMAIEAKGLIGDDGDDLFSLFVFDAPAKLIREARTSQVVSIFYKGADAGSIGIGGIGEALDKLVECREVVAKGSGADPFAE